jgi:hypothetical protein
VTALLLYDESVKPVQPGQFAPSDYGKTGEIGGESQQRKIRGHGSNSIVVIQRRSRIFLLLLHSP